MRSSLLCFFLWFSCLPLLSVSGTICSFFIFSTMYSLLPLPISWIDINACLQTSKLDEPCPFIVQLIMQVRRVVFVCLVLRLTFFVWYNHADTNFVSYNFPMPKIVRVLCFLLPLVLCQSILIYRNRISLSPFSNFNPLASKGFIFFPLSFNIFVFFFSVHHQAEVAFVPCELNWHTVQNNNNTASNL